MRSYSVYSFSHPILSTPVNITVVWRDNSLLVFDTGPSSNAVSGLGIGPISLVLLTHYHWDHVLGMTGLGEKVDICASSATIDYLRNLKLIEEINTEIVYLAGGGRRELELFRMMFGEMYAEASLKASSITPLGGCRDLLKEYSVEYFGCPGHTLCHTCYRVSTGEGIVVIAGDTVLEEESPPTLNALSFLRSLYSICSMEWDFLVPGHGGVMDRSRACRVIGSTGVRKYERLRRVVEALFSRRTVSSIHLLREIYSQVVSGIEAFVKAYSLYGYLFPLREKGAISLERLEDNRGIRIELVDTGRAEDVLEEARGVLEKLLSISGESVLR